ncbi:unnamed protein product [Symbiodinium natans]|uniref:histidine--tRNA ligase n=1 Tax=Symbiodinium natans TaxID=878477 RepID=A0A812J5F6_9DINO|nr:unnamed protein product [Symbiodinium natans]
MSEKEKGKSEKKKDDKKKDDKKAAAKGPAISLDPPSGTRDFFPTEMRFRNWLFGAFKETARRYGFQEYDAPVLEHEELYKRKAGEEITEQMYNFIDKDGAAVTLRPEMTPSLARMVLSLMRAETGEMSALLPLKWSSIPQCWRFETCQRGRKREHYQWNMDIVGITSIHAEVELLSAITTFFELVGITSKEVGIKVNSRKVLGAVLKNAGVPDERFTETCIVIDKQDKIGPEAVVKELTENIGLEKAVAERIVNATAAKTLDEFAALAGVGESPEVIELRQLFTLAEEEGFGDWLIFDASVVRGLAYYTGVVFEGFDRAGVLRAICGGGRYDRLLTLYGSPKEVPCAGFGFGDCVIYELLKEKQVLPELPHKVDFVVAAFNQDMMGKALQVARLLRKAGKSVDVYAEASKKVAKAFNYADRAGAERIAFVAPDEWSKGLVRIKDLRNFKPTDPDELKQKDVPINDLGNVDVYFGQGPAASSAASTSPTKSSSAAPAPKNGSVTDASQLEAVLSEQSYVAGFRPSRQDRDLYESFRKDAGCPSSPSLGRWYRHIDSFSNAERMAWQ